jgi:FKBP-type peptidyl-prolyl cis-trans isomerase FklB
MRKQIVAVFALSVFGAILTGAALAQQTPPSNQSSSAPQIPSAKSAPASTAKKPAPAAPVLKTDRDKESYALGMNVAKGLQRSMKEQSVDVDLNLLIRGVKDELTGTKALLTDDEAVAALTKLQGDVRQKQAELRDKNLKDSDAFLAANKTKEGVITQPSGLQYRILTQGTGPRPTAADTVLCQYRGTLIDGTEFDDSSKRGPTVTMPVGGHMIKGWTEALEMMPAGSKWQIFIPPALAYGDRGAPGSPIGPNQVLIFEVQLLSVQPPGQSSAPGVTPAPNAQPTPQK